MRQYFSSGPYPSSGCATVRRSPKQQERLPHVGVEVVEASDRPVAESMYRVPPLLHAQHPRVPAVTCFPDPLPEELSERFEADAIRVDEPPFFPDRLDILGVVLEVGRPR